MGCFCTAQCFVFIHYDQQNLKQKISELITVQSDWIFSGKKLEEFMRRCISTNKIEATLICNLWNGNSKVFYSKQFIQNSVKTVWLASCFSHSNLDFLAILLSIKLLLLRFPCFLSSNKRGIFWVYGLSKPLRRFTFLFVIFPTIKFKKRTKSS